MSDLGRKDFSDKAAETVKPESQKSLLEQGQEQATNAYDTVAGSLQPSEEKSAGQKTQDTLSGGGSDKTLLDQAKDGVEQAKESLGLSGK